MNTLNSSLHFNNLREGARSTCVVLTSALQTLHNSIARLKRRAKNSPTGRARKSQLTVECNGHTPDSLSSMMAKIIYYAGLDYDKLPTSKRKIIEIQIDDDDEDEEPQPKRPSFDEPVAKRYSLDEPKAWRPSFEEPKLDRPPLAEPRNRCQPQIRPARPRQPPSHDLLLSTLKRYFNFDSFRENQLEAVNATCAGHDTLILMPTGGGKSICYQLPAIISQGITVVVSPLKSLIADQVERMRKLDVKTSALFGETSDVDAENIIWDLRQECPEHKLLFVTPEKISASGSLMNIFQRLHDRDQLARFVIDEAHCVSMWGSDFRPDYRKLNKLREQFPSVPIMALTATAPPKVRDDILAQLKMDKSLSKVFIQSFNRPNLKFEVRNKVKGCLSEISKLIKANFARQCGIIYCLSRNDCESVAAGLREQAISSAPYHAGLPDAQRQKVFAAWSKGTFQVVCATIAFGMGIDKSDVRFVIHYSMPKSIEGYYQEAGRAGRDGKFASCILYFSKSDLYRMKSMLSKTGFGRKVQDKTHDLTNLQHMIDYVDNRNECRRSIMLRYLGEEFDSKECISHIHTACDNCRLRYNR